jgi:hypothetical protein
MQPASKGDSEMPRKIRIALALTMLALTGAAIADSTAISAGTAIEYGLGWP